MWYINNIKLVVQEEDVQAKQLIARLNPIEADTVYHFFGWDTKITKLSAKVVGNADRDAILALTKTGTAYTISGPLGSYGNYLVSNATFKNDQSIYQTIRYDLDCTAPVYTAELELYYVSG